MKRSSLFALGLLLVLVPEGVQAQQEGNKKSEEEFVLESPSVGDPLPSVTVYAPDGNEVRTSDLRGHYTVLKFGCLT
jgi:hypothetical protein